MKDRRSKDDKIFRRMLKIVETKAGEIGTLKAEEEREDK